MCRSESANARLSTQHPEDLFNQTFLSALRNMEFNLNHNRDQNENEYLFNFCVHISKVWLTRAAVGARKSEGRIAFVLQPWWQSQQQENSLCLPLLAQV